MGRQYDVNLTSARAVDEKKTSAIDVILPGARFDVLVEFEVGSAVRAFNGDYTLYATVRNQTTLAPVATVSKSGSLAGQQTLEPTTVPETIEIPAGWVANTGDVLDVLVSLLYKTGSIDDQDAATTTTFLVSQ
ncbi:hypothetical protein [Cryptosporangium minutisporangium]|uniref:Uncharacterized protein n=1 Tax=Cryptosporangium minutisporangium TaxID=113569 RepID=A0ABP6T0Y0_9ACTN